MLGLASIITKPAKAQVRVNINIGTQPQWAPRDVTYADYYYLPDVESYYHVPSRKFICYSGNRWVHYNYLPGRYRNYNLYTGRKYVINAPRPYLQHNVYRVRYASYPQNRSYRNYERRERVEYRRAWKDDKRNRGRGHWKDHDHDRGRGRHWGRG